jgi:hypothetical protein
VCFSDLNTDIRPKNQSGPFQDWLELAYSGDGSVVESLCSEERSNPKTICAYAEYVLWTWYEAKSLLLARFSLQQIGTRLWNEWHIYRDPELPRELRDQAWDALGNLWRTVFIPNVSDSLAYLNESSPGREKFDGACYMWWDVSPVHEDPERWSKNDEEQFIALCRECLDSGRPAIQEAIIHGLGHAFGWDRSYPPAEALLKDFLTTGAIPREELNAYAEIALSGKIQ